MGATVAGAGQSGRRRDRKCCSVALPQIWSGGCRVDELPARSPWPGPAQRCRNFARSGDEYDCRTKGLVGCEAALTVDDDLDSLYGMRPEEFTARRNSSRQRQRSVETCRRPRLSPRPDDRRRLPGW